MYAPPFLIYPKGQRKKCLQSAAFPRNTKFRVSCQRAPGPGITNRLPFFKSSVKLLSSLCFFRNNRSSDICVRFAVPPVAIKQTLPSGLIMINAGTATPPCSKGLSKSHVFNMFRSVSLKSSNGSFISFFSARDCSGRSVERAYISVFKSTN